MILNSLNVEFLQTLSTEGFSSIDSEEETFSDSCLDTDSISLIISQLLNDISTEEHSVTEV